MPDGSDPCGDGPQEPLIDADTADMRSMCVDLEETSAAALNAADDSRYTAQDTAAPQVSAAECLEMATEGHIPSGGTSGGLEGSAGAGTGELNGGATTDTDDPPDRPFYDELVAWCAQILKGEPPEPAQTSSNNDTDIAPASANILPGPRPPGGQ